MSWRIPTGSDPRLLKLAVAQIGLATVVAALILLVAAPRQWLVPALAGLVPLAIFMAYQRWRIYNQSLSGPDNVRIDEQGLHWLDVTGQERSFARRDVLGYRLGRESDTLRPVPALTLYLAGDFKSQPIELHPPATPEAVRRILAGQWQLAEMPHEGESGSASYDRAIPVYSECHDDYQEWHWEGAKEALGDLFCSLRAAAAELPLPPPGTRPAQWTILAQRRDPSRLRIQHLPTPHFEHDVLAGPATLLNQIAAQAENALHEAPVPSDVKFDVVLGPRDRWTFHLHIREG